MDAIFINSKNSEKSDPRLTINLTDKIKLKTNEKYVTVSNLSIYDTQRNIKSHTKIINLRQQLRNRMEILNYQRDHIMHQIFETILNISLKKHGKKNKNP